MKIKRRFYSIIFFCSLVACLIMYGSSLSYGYEWSKTFGGSSQDWGNSAQQTTDGGYIIVGTTVITGVDDDIYLIKTDPLGNEIWTKTFGGVNHERGGWVQQTADGGYIIAGNTDSFDAGNLKIYLIKTDADGNEMWSKTFFGELGWLGNSLQQTSDGGYIITGFYRTPPPDDKDFVYLIKTDTDGNEIWSKTFDELSEGGGFGVQQTIDEGYIIVGAHGYFRGPWVTPDVYLIKTDAVGNEIWSKTFGGSDADFGFSVQQTTGGGYIITGKTGIYGEDVYKGDVYFIKTDAVGNEIWSKTFGGSENDEGNSVQQTDDGGYIIAGNTNSYGAGSYDVYLIKTDAAGNEQWSKTFGGVDYDRGNSVQQTDDGGYIIAGDTGLYGAGDADVYLIYYKPEYENLSYTPVTPCRIVDTRKTSAGIIDANTERDFRVFGDGSTISSQGGNSAGCPAPMGEPLAAHINMIAVNPTGKGNLQAFPRDASTGTGLSVNYNTIDTNLANAGSIKAVAGVGPDITVASNFSSAHTVIDVLGYFYPDEGLLYTPVMPCRIVDTRYTSAGIIDVNTERNFRVFGTGGAIFAQGGDPDGCPSPLGEPLAAHINMVAVYPYGKGNLQVFPVGGETGAGLSVNYNILDTNLANAGTVKTNEGAGADITVASNFSSANTVIDVLGYYYPDGDFLYTPVKPCRIVDTRKTPAGMIDANTERNFRVFGSGTTISAQGGDPAGCSSPEGEPLAVHVNMVAVNPTGKGNLQAFPVGAGPGAGLSVNYNTIDTNLANAGTVKTDTGVGPEITVVSNFSSAHTVIDALGYYYRAP